MSRVHGSAARLAAMVLVGGIALISVVGCQAGTPTPIQSSSGVPVSPTPSPVIPSPSPTASASALVAPCTAVDITLTLGAGGGGGAGHRYPYLVFTNDSGVTCRLSGHPAVSMVGGGSGLALGAKATPVSSTAKQVTLAPGKAAHAPLDVAVAENYDAVTCQPQPADGFRVVLPNDSGALFVAASDYVGCANAAIKLMKIKPFVAGAK